MRRLDPYLLAGSALAAALITPTVASAHATVTPYLEVDQTLDAATSSIDGGKDVVTYSTVAAGLNATATGRTVEGSLDFQYEHEFGEYGGADNVDGLYGVARGQVNVVPGLLSIQGGGFATRTRYDIRGVVPLTADDRNNVAQIYGGFIGPDLATHVGPLNVNAGYRFSYVKADGDDHINLPFAQPQLDKYDWSRDHDAYASVGMDTHNLYVPFGWTISGGYDHERTGSLDQLSVDKFVRGDVTVPVAPTVALLGGVGYENLKITQQAPLVDASGNFVTDRNGQYVGNGNAPRLLAYDTDGLIYDAGVMWKPSPRLTAQVLAVWRYHSWGGVGSLKYQLSKHSGLQIGVFDEVDSFGRALTADIVGLPTQFDVPRNALTNHFGGCIFGKAGQGGCFNDALQSITTSDFRSRGIYALWAAQRGRWSFDAGGGYAQRRYLTPVYANAFSLNGTHDRSWVGQADASYALSSTSTLTGSLFADYYESGIAQSPNTLTGGGTASIYHNFTDNLVAHATAGLYAYDVKGFDDQIEGELQVGAKYQF